MINENNIHLSRKEEDKQKTNNQKRECMDLTGDNNDKLKKHYLIAKFGSIHHRNMYPKQDYEEIKITSDTKPKLLISNEQQYNGNGQIESNEIYLIGRKKRQYFIVQKEIKNTYGFSTQSTEFDYENIEITYKTEEEIKRVLQNYEYSYYIDPNTEQVVNINDVKHFLTVKNGTDRAIGQGCSDSTYKCIVSDSEPILFAESNEDYTGNGKYRTNLIYQIQKDNQRFLVIKTEENHTYGYSTQYTDNDYKIINITGKSELVIQEILSEYGIHSS